MSSTQLALVTGISRGIGKVIATALIDEGYKVIGCSRSHPDEMPTKGLTWKALDVSEPQEVSSLHRYIETNHGNVSLLVNNAGIQIEKNVVESTDEDWENLVGANCRGVFNMCRAFIPMIEREGGGSIINIGSISGDRADPGLALYNASKGFVHSLTRSIAIDHGPKVRCNAICPGWIATDMASAAFAVASDPDRAEADAIARHPVDRMGQPVDIANAVRWLASAQAEFMTGQCITVDGGLTAAAPIRPDLF